MEFSAEMIASMVQGTVEGDPKATVNNFAKIEEGRPGCISFLANPKYAHYLYKTQSSIVLVARDFKLEGETKATLIRVDNPYETVAKLLQIYESMKPKRTGISELAFIDPTAKIGEGCYIGPFVAIAEGVEIGEGCILHPHVTVGRNARVGASTEIYSNAVIYHDCRVGQRCILHAGCIIGADGFGFAPTEKGYEKIPQIGIVTIEDDVEIGANTCIDRSTMGSTYIHQGVKLDNLIQVAHNCEVGSHTVMSSQVGIAGSTKIGEWCMFGGQVGIAGHATIPNRTMVGAQGGVPNSVKKEGMTLQGTPAIDAKTFWRSSAVFKNLPEMWNEVNRLRKELNTLQERIAQLTNPAQPQDNQ